MKTVSIRLEDKVYEQLSVLLNSMGQTKQTFYETYTLTALREQCIPFIIRSSSRPQSDVDFDKIAAFKELEAIRERHPEGIDVNKEREAALNEKYGLVN